MDVRLPDGTIIAGVPDGTTKAQLVEKLRSNGIAVPEDWIAPASAPERKQVSQQIGGALMEVPRQVGLTARAGIKSVAAIPAMLTDAVTGVYNSGADIANRVIGQEKGYRFGHAMPALDAAMTRAGLPEPASPDERVVGDTASMMLAAGGTAKVADMLSRAATPAAKAILQQLSARPALQIAGAAGAGGAGGAVKEAGGGPGAQFAAALAGGVGSAMAVDKASSLGRAAASALTPTPTKLAQADVQISLTLRRDGIDWSTVPERIKQPMRQEVAQALNSGQPLNADALRRLLAFRATRTTPTVGQLTQDPGALTREMNLAKTGANSTDPSLQVLPGLQNKNAAQLLQNLDEAGASTGRTLMDSGASSVNSLQALATRSRANTSALYDAARDSGGRSLPLDGGTFTRRASELLDESLLGHAVPSSVEKHLNQIAKGEIPLTVEVAEQLKTVLGNIGRAGKGDATTKAMSLIRQALDDAPLQNAKTWNPGQLPAVPGSVPPSTAASGQQAIDAFNAARRSHAQWMRLVETNPALKAVVDGVEPDQFMQTYVLGRGATAADMRGLAGLLDDGARQAVREALVKHLKDAATGATDDVVKFGGSSYRAAFRRLEDKLPAFFNADEVAALRAQGEAAKYMQAQPAGSAINNSNSGALLLGRGADMLGAMAPKVPILGDTISGVIQGLQQRQVMTPRNALSLAVQPPQPMRVNPVVAASLLSSPAEGRDKNRRN